MPPHNPTTDGVALDLTDALAIAGAACIIGGFLLTYGLGPTLIALGVEILFLAWCSI